MIHFTALYDACVLYPAPLRDLLMELALSELYRAKWSNRIHDEWIRNVLKSRPDITHDKLERTKQMMNMHVLDAIVENFEDIEKVLDLPDPNDNHVLAAAIVSETDVIVTFNLKDFPPHKLTKYNIKAQHPDLFLMHLTDLDQGSFLAAIKNTRSRLKKPPKSVDEYLAILKKQCLINTVTFLENHKNEI
ncbi:MAG: PIN domain-containing protein [Gammaproteobacteria bacterium]|nr:PIN domain-containing protein [Gammaproteobacteria bacterium]